MQLSDLFNKTNTLYPVLQLRSFLILSKELVAFYNQHNLVDTDLFIDYSFKIKKIIKNMLNFESSDLKEDMNDLWKKLEARLSAIDRFPMSSFFVFKKRVYNALDKLESKIIKFEKNNHKNLLDQFSLIDKKIFQNKMPQEESIVLFILYAIWLRFF